MLKSKLSVPLGQESHSRSFSLSGSTKLSNPPKKIEKSYEEEVMEKAISSVEKTRLNAVYELILRGGDLTKSDVSKQDIEKGINSTHLSNLFNHLDYFLPKNEIELLIWEIDEDGDEHINRYEFELMYKRSIFDKTYLEPRNLFNMIQFMMYDKQGKGNITVEDTLELLYVRVGRYNLDSEIYSIFGAEEKTSDGQEKAVNFKEYLEKMKKKDFLRRKELEFERKTVKPPLQDEK